MSELNVYNAGGYIGEDPADQLMDNEAGDDILLPADYDPDAQAEADIVANTEDDDDILLPLSTCLPCTQKQHKS